MDYIEEKFRKGNLLLDSKWSNSTWAELPVFLKKIFLEKTYPPRSEKVKHEVGFITSALEGKIPSHKLEPIIIFVSYRQNFAYINEIDDINVAIEFRKFLESQRMEYKEIPSRREMANTLHVYASNIGDLARKVLKD